MNDWKEALEGALILGEMTGKRWAVVGYPHGIVGYRYYPVPAGGRAHLKAPEVRAQMRPGVIPDWEGKR